MLTRMCIITMFFWCVLLLFSHFAYAGEHSVQHIMPRQGNRNGTFFKVLRCSSVLASELTTTEALGYYNYFLQTNKK